MVCCVCMEMFGVGFSVIGGLLTSFVVASQLGICGHLNDIQVTNITGLCTK